MFEIIICCAILFLVLVFFYKQTSDQFHILQIEAEKISTVKELLQEKNPIVIRGMGIPKILTPDILKATPRLHGMPLSQTLRLADLLEVPTHSSKIPPLELSLRKQLASEVGLSVWAEHSLLPVFLGNNPSWFLSMNSQAFIGSVGMEKSVAYSTLIYPTHGTFLCSIALESAEKYLPKSWKGKYISDLTLGDTPLLREIQFIDVVLRPGHILHIPPHWIYSIKSTSDPDVIPLFGIIEIHHPISHLSSLLKQ
jgi:hypothetical protein